MNINRNKNRRNIGTNNSKIPLTFDIRVLNLFCHFVLSENKFIRKHHLMNLKKMIDMVDPTTYENDIDKVNRIRFISKALEAKLDLRISNRDMVIEHIYAGLAIDIDFIDLDNIVLSSDEIEWINATVTESLKFSFVYNHIDQFQDICTRFKSTDYRHRGNIVKEFENILDETKNSFRQYKVYKLTDMTFSLQDGIFEEAITDTYELVTSPNRRLITGMQGFNQRLNGGFENGRVYMLFGMTAVGKSVTLLNLIYQLKRCNTYYVGKTEKRPCIVLLTMENSVVETITRLYDLAVQDGKMKDTGSVEEVINNLRTIGELSLTDQSPIDIVIKYKANRSVDTSYLYNLCDDLEDQGYEVIALFQDHVKRIKSIDKYNDLRLELGEVVNEFKNFAIEKDIPVISVSHLNRDAAKVIETGEQSGRKKDVTKLLGKSNVGESFLMLDNLDGGFIINLDYDENGNKYMVFSATKIREAHVRSYMAQPFVGGTGIRLVEDLYTVPLFKESLHSASLDVDIAPNMRASSYSDMTKMDIRFKPTVQHVDSDNIFNESTDFSSRTITETSYSEEDDYDNMGMVIPNRMVTHTIEQQPKQKVQAIRFFTNVDIDIDDI